MPRKEEYKQSKYEKERKIRGKGEKRKQTAKAKKKVEEEVANFCHRWLKKRCVGGRNA